MCTNGVEIRQARLDTAVVDALTAALSAPVIEAAVQKAPTTLRENRAREADRSAALDRERAAIAARIAHLGDAIKRGKATESLLDMLATEETARTALTRELAALEAVAALDAATVARELQGIAGETIRLLHSYPAQTRQMVRKLLDGGRLRCEPVTVDGRAGSRFHAIGTYARLLAGTVVNDVGVPDGFCPQGAPFVVEGRAVA